jgi:phosphoribosyl-ATP pyrophosphohydrolase
MKNQLKLEELLEIIHNKINSQDQNSYVKKLSEMGIEKISQKVGEEAVEVVIASLLYSKNLSKNQDENKILKTDLINELSDLFFHSLILMAHNKISFEEIFLEFYQRNINKNDRN